MVDYTYSDFAKDRAIVSGTTRKINKQVAARDQLIAAVELLFGGRHTLGAHVLTCSAAQILGDLYKHAEAVSLVERLAKVLADQGVNEKRFLAAQRALYNFSKHADRDHKDRFEHNIVHTEHLLWAAIFDYMNMFGALADELFAYYIWHIWVHPQSVLPNHPLFPVLIEILPRRVPSSRSQRLLWARKLISLVQENRFPQFHISRIPREKRPSLAELRIHR